MTDLDPRPHPDLVDRLERHLARTGATIDLRPLALPATIARARQRQRRRNVAVASSSVLLVVSAITAVTVLQRPDTTPADVDRSATTAPATAVPDTAAPDTAAPATTTIPGSIRDTTPDTTAATSADGAEADPMIASDGADPASWTFGRRIAWDPNSADDSRVFLTDDGVAWDPVPASPGLRVWGGERDAAGTIRLVGASTADRRAVLATSVDAGRSWTLVDLGTDPALREVAQNGPVGFLPVSASLATHAGTTVVGISDGGGRRWLLTVAADGSVIDAADTGLDLGNETPVIEATQYLAGVVADEQGFVAIGGYSSDVTTLTFWTSADGRTWNETGTTEASVSVIGRLGSLLVSAPPRIATSADGNAWQSIEPTGVIGDGEFARWTPQAATIDDGQLVVVLLADGAQPVASFVKDGVRVDVTPDLDTTLFDAATGEYLGGFVDNTYDGPVRTVGATFELLDEDGEVRVSVSLDEATAALRDVGTVDRPDQWAIATSSDLASWTVSDITDLVVDRVAGPGRQPVVLGVDVVDGRPTVRFTSIGSTGSSGPTTVIRTAPR